MNQKDLKAKIFLKGGIGNNLFQYAQGIYLSNRGYQVTYNTFLTRKNLGTRFLRWSVHRDDLRTLIFSGENVEQRLALGDVLFLVKEYLRSRVWRKRRGMDQAGPSGAPSIRLTQCNASGPHMSREVFKELRHKIIESVEEQFPRPFTMAGPVIVHYRAGDFPARKRIQWGYYRDCLKDLGPETTTVHWITDDPEALTRLTAGDPFEHRISSASSATADFLAMFRANTLVCSNSTFCYWAAVLGDADILFVPNRTAVDNTYDLPLFAKSVRKINCTFLAETG